jgi:hypothetical protein
MTKQQENFIKKQKAQLEKEILKIEKSRTVKIELIKPDNTTFQGSKLHFNGYMRVVESV